MRERVCVVVMVCRIVMCAKSEMDDNLSNETHHHTGVPDCIGPVCVYDTLVIEMIAKPALPKLVQ